MTEFETAVRIGRTTSPIRRHDWPICTVAAQLGSTGGEVQNRYETAQACV